MPDIPDDVRQRAWTDNVRDFVSRKAKEYALPAARRVAEFVAPNADTLGAKGIAGVRSVFSGDSYENELARYNEDANPDPWASPRSRWTGSVVEDPNPKTDIHSRLTDPQSLARAMAMGSGMASPIAFHGSPHVFDKFSMDKIGTGEGAQAYGHGLYFTSEPKVAEGYREGLSRPDGTYVANGKRLSAPGSSAPGAIEAAEQELTDAIRRKPWLPGSALKQTIDSWRRLAEIDPASYGPGLARLESIDPKTIAAHKPEGSFHQVDIPDNLLDYDRPLAEQAPEVQRVAREFLATTGARPEGIEAYMRNATGQELIDRIGGQNGQLTRSEMARTASARLRDAGIPGHRYRGDSSGVENYVIYDDAQIKPLGRWSSLTEFLSSKKE